MQSILAFSYYINRIYNKEKVKMTGIYLITNNINGKIYIGQSIDIKRRYAQHQRSGQPDKYANKNERDSNTPIHLAMQKYGIENFTLSILEQCSKDQLDEKEKYWIKKYNSCNKQIGYNISEGGQDKIGAKGEFHSQAKLTQKEVDDIKYKLKNTTLSLTEINKEYPQVTKGILSMINQGHIWIDENEKYPLRVMNSGSKGSKNPRSKISEKIAMEIRIRYSEGESPTKLAKEYSEKYPISESGVKAIIYGRSYKFLPIWNKNQRIWIEPCIDQS